MLLKSGVASFSTGFNRLPGMWNAYGMGRFFIQVIGLRKDAPRMHRSTTQVITRPFRIRVAILIRIFGERTIVLGRWNEFAQDEDDAMRRAIQAHDTELLDPDGFLLDRDQTEDDQEIAHVA